MRNNNAENIQIEILRPDQKPSDMYGVGQTKIISNKDLKTLQFLLTSKRGKLARSLSVSSGVIKRPELTPANSQIVLSIFGEIIPDSTLTEKNFVVEFNIEESCAGNAINATLQKNNTEKKRIIQIVTATPETV